MSDDKYYNGKLFNMCTDAELNDAQQEYWELMHDVMMEQHERRLGLKTSPCPEIKD